MYMYTSLEIYQNPHTIITTLMWCSISYMPTRPALVPVQFVTVHPFRKCSKPPVWSSELVRRGTKWKVLNMNNAHVCTCTRRDVLSLLTHQKDIQNPFLHDLRCNLCLCAHNPSYVDWEVLCTFMQYNIILNYPFTASVCYYSSGMMCINW